ncbi:DUF1640 domain-containing protein [Candidatus Hamiltonella defensa]|uniref:DUF1640 domain-containing protein n=2 Tax=Candidatus Williamhamiltonella defendens TaxID=138072 RepID=A0A4P2SP24_9ENTR|nr:DUF1640 domain-containing protein [Candidatus Hamiltonella defensa]ASV34418.1 DUF1640 domain-containing protein [Candidatus Hamiltonella defensa]AWK17368.1 DUF1640 domain-containing protein [Candidatus Hamiltonella defensa]AWK17375.1 DUF1640 domain-containing protein [Candidatus Hamiltonella defensa]MBK4361585.1 DUF1640 domain-containing protein [Candidatus Hamiltonella defensa]
MNYLASDTFQILEDLEESGLDKKQAKAIFQVIRQSHEAKDVATKADIADVKRDIADVRKDMDTRFEKVDAQFADIRKDMDTRFEKVDVQFADIRKDMDNKLEKLGLSLTIKMGGMIGFLVVSIGLMLKYLR